MWCTGFSLQSVALGMWAVVLWHVGYPGPGIKPVSPALAGRFSATGPLRLWSTVLVLSFFPSLAAPGGM